MVQEGPRTQNFIYTEIRGYIHKYLFKSMINMQHFTEHRSMSTCQQSLIHTTISNNAGYKKSFSDKANFLARAYPK
jgi:hypothetical protein